MIAHSSQSEAELAPEAIGESSGVELLVEDDSLADRTDLLETIEALRATGLDLAAKNRQAIVERDQARAELAAMRGGMIQRVGQRFLNADGETITITEFRPNGVPGFPWIGVNARGTWHEFNSSGISLVGRPGSPCYWTNLVGPAPDELAEANVEAQRQHDRVQELIAEKAAVRADYERVAILETQAVIRENKALQEAESLRAELKAAKFQRDQFRAALGESIPATLKVSPEAFVDLMERAEPGFGEDDLRHTIEQAILDTYRVDPRTGEAGFGASMEPQLFVVIQTPPEIPMAVNGRDFVARLTETGDGSVRLYAAERTSI